MSEPVQGQSVPYAVYERVLNESIQRKGKLVELKKANAELTTERDTLKASVGTLTTERDTLASKANAAPDEKDKKISELTDSLRGIKHRAVFDKLAKTADVRDEAKDDLWAALQYKPEADEADEAKLSGLVTEALKGRAYMVQADPQAGSGVAGATRPAPIVQPSAAGPGAARGSSPSVSQTSAKSVMQIVAERAAKAGIAMGGAPIGSER
jgi:hypothetical protein